MKQSNESQEQEFKHKTTLGADIINKIESS